MGYTGLMTNATLPLVLPSQTSIPINNRFAVSTVGDLRIILLEGQPIMGFHKNDKAGRDMMIVQMCIHGGLSEERVARALEVSRPTV